LGIYGSDNETFGTTDNSVSVSAVIPDTSVCTDESMISVSDVNVDDDDFAPEAEVRLRAINRLTVRIDIARWKYQWEMVSLEAVLKARLGSKRKR
jgi:hypothetical protein